MQKKIIKISERFLFGVNLVLVLLRANKKKKKKERKKKDHLIELEIVPQLKVFHLNLSFYLYFILFIYFL